MAKKQRNERKDFQILDRKDLQRLAELHAEEATILVANGKEQGAYYLCGLAVECALKACLAKGTKQHEFPNKDYAAKVYVHDLNELLKVAGLQDQRATDERTNPALAANWGVVMGWTVESRYEHSGLPGTDMCTALNSPDGVLTWIKRHW